MAEKSKKFRLRIVTPAKTAVDKNVDMVIMQTVDGQIGVLSGHEPLTTVLGIGTLRYYDDEKIERVALLGGFTEIGQTEVVVLADIAEHPDEIDAERARRAEERARKRLKDKAEGLDYLRAELALRKSLVRQEIMAGPLTSEKK
ncbi:MAG: F0F1 ATP synthase subunit epsilon [Defluviitaleaceae bacterium]|nr:F0F1 ATP synthase subunit epsilon [Defluviitaleaceae bacterium]